MLTIQQVAREMQVTDRTVRRWINQEGLGVIRISHKVVRIPRSNLMEFLASRETGS